MKTRMRITILAALVAAVGVAPGAAAQKATIGVMNFENKAGIDGRVASGLSDMLTTSLAQTGKFTIVERSRLDRVYDEQALGASGAVDPATAAKIGKSLGAGFLILGAVTEASAKKGQFKIGGVSVGHNSVHLAIDARVVDTDTAEVVWADHVEDSKSAPNIGLAGQLNFDLDSGPTAELARGLTMEIANEIIATVYPPKIIDFQAETGQVIVNLGGTFFEQGKLYDVVRRGEPVRDSETGDIITYREERLGQIRVTTVEERATHAVLVEGSVEVGAIVKLTASANAKPASNGNRFNDLRKRIFKKKKD